jgi:hypothetical protein
MNRIVSLIVLVLLATPLYAAEKQREKIGEALGNPIYRDQIDERQDLYGQLHNLFRMPFQKKYLEAHKNKLEPKDWEIEYVVKYFEKKHNDDLKKKDSELNQRLVLTKKQIEDIEKKLSSKSLSDSERKTLEMEKIFLKTMLKPPGKDFAKYLLSNWKYYRLLYDDFGGGRIIWEQEGLVAYDAMLKWLKHHEKQGDFKITDPKLHEAFYSYWKDNENSRFFLDQQRIQSEFLHPEWEPTKNKKSK